MSQFAWYAAGSYVNDDGEQLNVLGNYNLYALSAYVEKSAPSVIVLFFNQYYTAYNYNSTMGEEGC